MKVTVLGSGTSHGVPVPGCDCAVCTSTDPNNKRCRPSILVTTESGANILVDTPPELRLQLLTSNITRLDAILFTHSHADHIFGLDDVRSFNMRQQMVMPVYSEPNVERDIRRIFDYIFTGPQIGGGKPQIDLRGLELLTPFVLDGLQITPLRVYHGNLPILAFKFGTSFAYVTDVSHIPDETWPHLKNLDLLILDAVRRQPHDTHFHLDKSLEVVGNLKPKRTLFTHLSHDYDHAEVNRELPPGVELAYDTQVVDL